MHKATIVVFFALFLLEGCNVVAASSSMPYATFVGKTMTWNVDANVNGYFDSQLVVNNITSLSSDITTPGDLSCNMTFISNGSIFSLSGSPLQWNGFDLVARNSSLPGGNPASCVGVTRTTIYQDGKIGKVNCVIYYDSTTLVLLSISVNATDAHGKYRTFNYVELTDTNIFITTKDFEPIMIALAGIFVSVIAIYVVDVVITSKRRNKARAKFDQDFWGPLD